MRVFPPFPTLAASCLLAALASAQTEADRGRRTVAILVYPGVELLDFAGPGEVFSAAHGEHGRAFQVVTVAESKEPLVSQGFVRITPQHDFDDCPRPDIIVLPGGNAPTGRPAVIDWVRRVAPQTEITLSVCNGALLLATAGLLDGLSATTHHGSLDLLMLSCPKTKIEPTRRFVDNGRIVTSAGVSAGIDAALHVVTRLHGEAAARSAAFYMEYDWDPERAHVAQERRAKRGASTARVELARIVRDSGVAAAAQRWQEMAEPPGEQDMNTFGYTLLAAIPATGLGFALLELNTVRFPESANAWDSLADGHEAKGQRDDALRCARRCLELIEKQAEWTPGWRERVRASAQAKIDRITKVAGNEPVTEWVCPPCPMDCHDRTYRAPGNCAVCGMRLVPKTSPAPAKDG